MTTTATTRPPTTPRDRTHLGLDLGRGVVMTLFRGAVLVAAGLISSHSMLASADPVGAGLIAFFVIAGIAFGWGVLDGRRHPLRRVAPVWSVTAALYVALGPLASVLGAPVDEGGWTGLADYLALITDGAGFVIVATALPAAVGLGVGHLVRRGTPPTRS